MELITASEREVLWRMECGPVVADFAAELRRLVRVIRFIIGRGGNSACTASLSGRHLLELEYLSTGPVSIELSISQPCRAREIVQKKEMREIENKRQEGASR
jgi:hypothetical protein